MRRISLVAVGTLLALAALAGTALAKEGAITKFDQLPAGGFHAGQTYTLGYTILMDGVEPYKADTTEILVRNANGKALAYPGIADGKPGHYVAKVFFPIAGSWTMQVTQGSFFPPINMGTMTVLAPVAPTVESTAAAPGTNPASDPLAPAISVLALLVALGGAVRLAQLARTHRRLTATT
ncbi:MAG TPA: hypothetical protein VGR87_11910 [Candidatus Limnocylindria bacterium]|jgi:hypothetical protein|nr:hypothetical protein [Candidatus Limnocylindria bacterium]